MSYSIKEARDKNMFPYLCLEVYPGDFVQLSKNTERIHCHKTGLLTKLTVISQ